ncbi:hypothetical protein BGX28_009496 [Mortierella sp. GBA30]|nr:hypothetical protein BGX28_009496 [Mortierella sp. GBA30]
MLGSATALIARVAVLNNSDSAPVTMSSTITMAIVWLTALPLNYLQHSREIRSNSIIFALYVINIAWPRGHTTVQHKSDVNDYKKANLLTFQYIQPLFAAGFNRLLTAKDITNMIPEKVKAKFTHNLLNKKWHTPYETCIAIWLLYRQTSWPVFVGVVVILVIGPVNGYVSNIYYELVDAKMEATNARVNLMNEVLSGMKVIKLYGWVESFQQHISGFRRRELTMLRKVGVTFSLMSIMFLASMSHVVQDITGLRVSANRLQNFLLAEQISDTATVTSEILPEDPGVPLIEVNDGTFAWGQKPSEENGECDPGKETETNKETEADKIRQPTLLDINMKVYRGELMAIVGRVGQGKTSILSAILGDMYKLQGGVRVRLESLSAFVVLGAAVSAVLGRNSLDAASVGLALTYALTSAEMFTGLVRASCDVESQLVAVERINEYANKNEEAPAVTSVNLPKSWPETGHIKFRNYSAHYRRGLDFVVKNVSFDVQPA